MTNTTTPRRNGSAKLYPAAISTQVEQVIKDALTAEREKRGAAEGRMVDEAEIVREWLLTGAIAAGYPLA
jgi:hypothetical protein